MKPPPSPSGTLGPGLPPYDEYVTGRPSTRARHTDSESNDFDTIVTEVAIVRDIEVKISERFAGLLSVRNSDVETIPSGPYPY